MNENTSSSAPATLNSGADDVAGLYRMLVLALVAMCLVAGCLAGYLYGQRRMAKSEIVKAHIVIDNYQTNVFPQLTNIQAQLLGYGRTHPEVMPILTKYGMGPTPTPAAAAAPPTVPAGTTPKAATPRR